MNGKVKWFNQRKDYGFIIGEDGKEVFVHKTEIPIDTSLNEGDSVEYDIKKTDKGIEATKVQKP
jgi:CspA family cold shock protein